MRKSKTRGKIQDASGVVVIDVESGSKAEIAGVRVGDIIREVNHIGIDDMKDFEAVLAELKEGDVIQLFVRRMGMGFLVIKLTK